MNEWISVKDELPQIFVDVLVHPQHDTPYSSKITAELDSDGFWVVQCEDSHYCYDEIIKGVTHWMPLPKPPTQ